MSLISINNFIRPLQNKVHLVTLVLVVIVFAMARLQGAKVTVVDSESEGRALKKLQERELVSENGVSSKTDVGLGSNPPAGLDTADTSGISELIKPQVVKEAKKVTAPDGRPKNDGLESIERELGLKQ